MKSRNTRRSAGTSVKRLLGVAAAGAITLLMKQQSASASPYTWTLAGNGSWALGTNWDTMTPPAVDGSAQLVFNEATGRTTINGSTTSATTNYLLAVNSITFAAGTGANILNPSASSVALSIGTGGIINSSSATQTIGGTVAIGDGVTETWFSGSTATSKIVLSSVSALAIGTSSSLTLSSSATASSISLAGSFILGSNSTLYQSGNGLVSVAGTSTIQSGANLKVDNGGTLLFGHGLTVLAGNISVGSGVVSLGNAANLQSSTLTINGGTWTPGNAGIFSNSTISVAAGTLTFGPSTTLTASSFLIGSANSSSTIRFTNIGNYTPASWTIQSGVGSTISLVNTTTGTPVTLAGSMVVNNNFNIVNSGVSGTTVLNVGWANSTSAAATGSSIIFDGSGNTANTLELGTNTASTSGFTGSVSIKSGQLSMGNLPSPKSIWLGSNTRIVGGGLIGFSPNIQSSITLGGTSISLNDQGAGYYMTMSGVISESSAGTPLSLVVGVPNAPSVGLIALNNTNTYTGTTTIQGGVNQIWGGSAGNGYVSDIFLNGSNALGGGSGGTGGLVSFAQPLVGATVYTPFQEVPVNVQLGANQQVKGLDNSMVTGDVGSMVGNSSSAVTLTLNSPSSASGSNLYSYSGLLGKSGNYTGLGTTSTLVTVADAATADPITMSSSIGVVVTGAGTQRLTGIQSNYTGGTTISGGATLQVSDNRNLGATTGAVKLDGGTLETSTGVAYSMSTILNGVSTATFLADVTPTLGAASGSLPGVYAGGSVDSIGVTGGGSGYASAPAVNPLTIQQLKNATFYGSYSANVSGGAVTGVNVLNGGEFLSSIPTITFSSGTAAATVSSMDINTIVQVSSGYGVSNPTITVGTTSEAAIVTNPTIANAVILTSNGGTLMQDAGSYLSLTGAITGTSSTELLNKAGAGTLYLSSSTSSVLGTFQMQGGTTSLSAANANAAFASTSRIIVGDTQANSGATFDVTGSTASYVFNSGQSVSGYGTLVGTNAVVASGATLNPGTSSTSGSLAVTGNLSVAGGANLLYNMGGSSTSTTTNVSSLFTLGASTASKVNLTVSNVGLGVYSLFTFGSYAGATGTITGDFNVTGVPGIDTYSVVQSANDIELQVSGAPQIAEHVATNTSGRGDGGTIALQSNSAVNYYGRTDVNGGTGATKGVITVDRSALGSPFTFNSPQIFLFQFETDSTSANNVGGHHYGGAGDGNQVADAAALSALEADLSAAGYTFVDYAGNNDPTATNTGGGGGSAANDATLAQALSLNSQYDLAIELEGPTTGNPSYMDFDFSAYGGGITTFNVAAVPEPASLSLVALSAMGLLGRRRSRKSRKGKMEAANA